MRKPDRPSPVAQWANMSDAIFHFAEKTPTATAIIEAATQTTLTYKDLASLVGKAAVWLKQLGVKPGDRVAAAMATGIDHIVLSFALMRVGAVPLDMPPKRPLMALVDPMKRFELSRSFIDPDATKPGSGEIHVIDGKWRPMIAGLKGDFRFAGNPDEQHYLSVTSGSTGVPKGVVTTHRQWLARFDSAARLFPKFLDAQSPPNLLVIGGMGFSAFFFYLANQLFIGGPVILMSENHEADFLIAAINQWDDTVTLVTPALARQFLSKAPAEGVLFPKMRALCIGAAPLYATEKRQILAKLSPNFYEVYGNAACGFISSLHPDEIMEMAESVGRPAPSVTLEVVDAEGKVLPAGITGHLRMRGPGISEKFIGPADTSAKGAEGFRDGWYYPGDLGSLGSNGQIYLSGRNADIVRRNGIEILPSEIEEVFLAHSSVADAAAVVGPTNEKGDQLVVFVVPKGEPNTRELSAYSRGKIAAEKFPDKVYFVREMPKNANGKVDKAKLKTAALRNAATAKPAEPAEKVG